jgi:hypothetical protein
VKPTRADFEEYFRLHAEAAKAKARMEELRVVLLPHLREGFSSPKDLPYSLTRRVSTRIEKDYRTPLLAELCKRLGKDRGERRLVEIEADFPEKEVESLHVSPNKDYAIHHL